MAVLGRLLKSSIKFTSTIQQIRKLKPAKWQKKAFTKLLSKARYTQFGEKFNFEEILSSAIFENGDEFYDKFKKNDLDKTNENLMRSESCRNSF